MKDIKPYRLVNFKGGLNKSEISPYQSLRGPVLPELERHSFNEMKNYSDSVTVAKRDYAKRGIRRAH